jgi:hypothetical protein
MSLHTIISLAQVCMLSLPFFKLSKWLEQKIKPKDSFVRFLLWFITIISTALLWFFIGSIVYYKFRFLNK